MLQGLAALRQFLDSPASSLFFDVPWAPVFLFLLFLVHPLLGTIGLLSAVALLLFAVMTELATREPLAHANLALRGAISDLRPPSKISR